MGELIQSAITSADVSNFLKMIPLLQAIVIIFQMDGLKKQTYSSLNLTRVAKFEFTVESSCLIWRNRVVAPFQLRRKVLTELHENHSGIVRMKTLAPS